MSRRTGPVIASFASLSLAFLLAASPAFGTRPYGADFSHWNGTITLAQWQTLYANGWTYAWTKATESPYCYNGDGTGYCGCSWYTDNTFVNNMTYARQAGILIGCYHFAHPECYTAIYEADGFISRAGAYISAGYLRPVLDLEDGRQLGATALSTWVNAFCDRIELQTGVEPIIYTNTDYCQHYLNSTVAGRTLWLANYDYPNEQTDNPPSGVFSTFDFWQYSDNGTLPGLTGSHDVNVFNGVEAGLQAYVIPDTIQPPYIVESRANGQHYANYSETGSWSDGASKSTAPMCTGGIGHRFCTINSTAKTAIFSFTPPTSGSYEVFTTNCTTSNSGNPMIHRVTHAGGTATVSVCQNTTCGSNAVNVWYSLGTYTLNASTQYTVTLDGSTTSGTSPSNNAGRSDAVKWELVSVSQSPTIYRSPSALTPSCTQGQNASSQTFTVQNTGVGTLSYSITDNQAWLSCSPTSGTSTGESDTITVSYSTSGLTAGTYNGTITISDPNASNNPQTIAVTLTVTGNVTTIINDTFDSYADQAAFVAAWPAGTTSLELSTARYYSSSKSLYSANSATGRSNKKTFTETYGTDASPVVLSVRFYDPGTTGTANQWIELRDNVPTSGKQLIQFGLYSGCSTTAYSARVTYSPGNGWVATSVSRSTGWHELKIVAKSTTMDFYVDGTLASSNRAYASSEGAVSWEEMRIGSGYASAGVYANYDNVLLQKGQ